MWLRARSILFGLLISIFLPASLRAAGKPNIILITLDSTRSDRMGFLGSHSALTPNLDGFARESIFFEHAYAQALLMVVSLAIILTGTYPQPLQVRDFDSPLATALSLLPHLPHAHG